MANEKQKKILNYLNRNETISVPVACEVLDMDFTNPIELKQTKNILSKMLKHDYIKKFDSFSYKIGSTKKERNQLKLF